MPKKIFAVTNVKVGSNPEDFFAAGSEVDTSRFTRDALMSLHDAGAIEVRVVDEEPTADVPSADDAAKTAETATDETSTDTDGTAEATTDADSSTATDEAPTE